jgi:hypothetical protein
MSESRHLSARMRMQFVVERTINISKEDEQQLFYGVLNATHELVSRSARGC